MRLLYPGMIMTAAGLLKRTPKPSETEIRIALEGNICRCTGYHNIVKAIQRGRRKHRSPAAGRCTPVVQ